MWHLVDENNIASLYTGPIADFWANNTTHSHFVGKGGITIRYASAVPKNPKHTIVLCNGRIETLVKYKEFIYECYKNDIAVFTLDHRGQGLSARMILDRQRGFVDNFDDYVDDFCQFVTQFVQPVTKTKPTLVCHSMGGAIGFLSAVKIPNAFRAAVFCSPMFGIKPTLPKSLLSLFLHLGLTANKLFGRRPWYALGQGAYMDIPFTLNALTHSADRYQLLKQEYRNDPRLQLGGVTYQWLHQAVAAMDSISALADDFSLSTKVIISGADKIVDNDKIEAVAGSLTNATLLRIAGARHELLFEADQYRKPAVTAIFDFVSNT